MAQFPIRILLQHLSVLLEEEEVFEGNIVQNYHFDTPIDLSLQIYLSFNYLTLGLKRLQLVNTKTLPLPVDVHQQLVHLTHHLSVRSITIPSIIIITLYSLLLLSRQYGLFLKKMGLRGEFVGGSGGLFIGVLLRLQPTFFFHSIR